MSLKDFSAIVSLIPGGDFQWVGRGVNAQIKSTGDRVKVYGFTSKWQNTKDIDADKNENDLYNETQSYLRKMLNEFSPQAENPDQKALVCYYDTNAKHRQELMMVKADDIERIECLENSQQSEYAVMSVLMDQSTLESVMESILDESVNQTKRTLLFKMLRT